MRIVVGVLAIVNAVVCYCRVLSSFKDILVLSPHFYYDCHKCKRMAIIIDLVRILFFQISSFEKFQAFGI